MSAIGGKKAGTLAGLLALILAALGYVLVDGDGSQSGETGVGSAETAAPDPVRSALLDNELVYTRHARCRMDCRHIDADEVDEILREGRINRERTRRDGPCTSYALEGRTSDDQNVRIVYADCDRETRVVTAIDLDRNWPCSCD